MKPLANFRSLAGDKFRSWVIFAETRTWEQAVPAVRCAVWRELDWAVAVPEPSPLGMMRNRLRAASEALNPEMIRRVSGGYIGFPPWLTPTP